MEKNIHHDIIGQARIDGERERLNEFIRKAKREIGQRKRYIELLQSLLGQEVNFYEIWIEGYLCTGMEGIPAKARFLGMCPGEDFYDACCNYNTFMTDPDDKEPYVNLHPERRTASIWGCRLYDNEKDARQAFG